MASMQLEKHLHLQRNAYMTNKTTSKMRLERFRNFCKSESETLPPGTIEADTVGKFSQFPPKAAVVYVGHNASEKHRESAWLLAWDTTPETKFPPSHNKVFIACGHKSVIDKMTDEYILKRLNDAPSAEAVATDPITETTVRANLSEHLIPLGFRLDATFGLTNN